MRRTAAILIAVGGIFYASWFLQWTVSTHLNPISSYISELSATDQPNHWLFRWTDLIAGTCLVLGSVAALLSTSRSRWVTAGWVSLALFGLSSIADALTPLPCAATAEKTCDLVTDRGLRGTEDLLHTLTSGGEDLFFALTMLSLVIVAFRLGVPSRLRQIVVLLTVAIVLAWCMSTASAIAFQTVGDNSSLGLWQRLQVLLTGIWLVVVAHGLLRAAPDRADQRS